MSGRRDVERLRARKLAPAAQLLAKIDQHGWKRVAALENRLVCGDGLRAVATRAEPVVASRHHVALRAPASDRRKRYACVMAESIAECDSRHSWTSVAARSAPRRVANVESIATASRAIAERAVVAERVEPHSLAELAQGVERARRRLRQRRRRVDRAQRFAGLAAQLTRELVGRVDQAARTVAGFAERRQLSARVGADEPDRHDVAAGHAGDVCRRRSP